MDDEPLCPMYQKKLYYVEKLLNTINHAWACKKSSYNSDASVCAIGADLEERERYIEEEEGRGKGIHQLMSRVEGLDPIILAIASKYVLYLL